MADKSQRNAVFRAFMSREGPQSLGTVTWPTAKRGALKGQKLLVTGILDTIERESLNELLVNCSGHVMSGMSKKLDLLIVGRDAGPKKLQNADEWGLKQMGEQEFYQWLTEKLNQFTEQTDDAADEEETPTKKPAAKRSQSKPAAGESAKKKVAKK